MTVGVPERLFFWYEAWDCHWNANTESEEADRRERGEIKDNGLYSEDYFLSQSRNTRWCFPSEQSKAFGLSF